ncbi:MAG: HAD family hydrolase [Clostridiales bacterium]|nr:HAD family hydrolase [Clostridiales bacterium]
MSRNIKLIVTDLDGTFVPDMWNLVPENLKALKAAKEAGIRVCACTGRHWGMARTVLEAGEFDPICIASNGAAILHAHTGEYYEKKLIKKEWLLDIVAYLKQKAANEPNIGARTLTVRGYGGTPGMDYIRFCDKNVFLNWNEHIVEDVLEHDVYLLDETYPMTTRLYRREADWIAAAGDTIERILFDIGRSEVEDVLELRKELSAIAPVEVTSAYGTVIEITHNEATKGNALKWLCNHYGIPQSQTLAMGDGLNDMPMVQWAAVGVAVGNARPALKEVADIVAPNVADGGFAKVVYDCIEGRI